VPRNRYGVGRDPWFDRLTTLSEVEGESRKIGENQIILDPGSRPAPWDLAGMTNCNTVSGGPSSAVARYGGWRGWRGEKREEEVKEALKVKTALPGAHRIGL
jgi:hypothetical protein